VAVAWSINLIDPELVILSGSISKAHEYFMPALDAKLRKNICQMPSEKTEVVLAKLGDYAGFIGASCLVLENYHKKIK
jgi:glucokinase